MVEILLMEDNPADIALFQIGLSESLPRCTLNVIDNQEQLITALHNTSANQSSIKKIVILDLFTPTNNGLDILKVIRQNHIFNFIPILILTNSQETNVVETAYQLGVNAFLFKPNDYDDFLIMIKGIVNFFHRG